MPVLNDIANITFKDELAIIKTVDNKGVVKVKNISIESLCKALANTDLSYSFELPSNCRFLAESRGSLIAALVVPAHVGPCELMWEDRDIKAFGNYEELIPQESNATIEGIRESSTSRRRRFIIPYPNLLFIVSCRRKPGSKDAFLLKTLFCYALKTTNMPLKLTNVFKYPFTNVFGNNSCCLGPHSEEYPTLASLSGAPSLVLRGVGNHDLDHGNLELLPTGEFGEVTTGYQLIVKLHEAKATKFPDQYLRPLHSSMQNTIDGILGI